jgi:hypothetical protein
VLTFLLVSGDCVLVGLQVFLSWCWCLTSCRLNNACLDGIEFGVILLKIMWHENKNKYPCYVIVLIQYSFRLVENGLNEDTCSTLGLLVPNFREPFFPIYGRHLQNFFSSVAIRFKPLFP